jgi:thiamine biosynthesis protein ThiS
LPAQVHNLQAVVNGAPMELPLGTTILDLLKILEIGNVPVAVEQNLEIVRKTDYAQRIVSEGDNIEIVHFVGGG